MNLSGLLTSLVKGLLGTTERPQRPTSVPGASQSRTAAPGDYPGDFTGLPSISYSPTPDDNADPGEVVWAWVPYEEDHSQGKDRPVLVIGHDAPWLLALPLTSQDHDRDAAQEARAGRFWIEIGTGAWDRSGRTSEARVNRILRIDPGAVRRIGARLEQRRFDAVAAAVGQHYG